MGTDTLKRAVHNIKHVSTRRLFCAITHETNGVQKQELCVSAHLPPSGRGPSPRPPSRPNPRPDPLSRPLPGPPRPLPPASNRPPPRPPLPPPGAASPAGTAFTCPPLAGTP
eukprot:1194193-Prorocentrum_minimum.AAC.4